MHVEIRIPHTGLLVIITLTYLVFNYHIQFYKKNILLNDNWYCVFRNIAVISHSNFDITHDNINKGIYGNACIRVTTQLNCMICNHTDTIFLHMHVLFYFTTISHKYAQISVSLSLEYVEFSWRWCARFSWFCCDLKKNMLCGVMNDQYTK